MSDDDDSDEVSARELWRIWRERYPVDERAEERWGEDTVRISWYVGGKIFESAPHAIYLPDYEPETFLDSFTTPIDVVTGKPIEWTRLPVEDKLWCESGATRAGSSRGDRLEAITASASVLAQSVG